MTTIATRQLDRMFREGRVSNAELVLKMRAK